MKLHKMSTLGNNQYLLSVIFILLVIDKRQWQLFTMLSDGPLIGIASGFHVIALAALPHLSANVNVFLVACS